MGTKGREHPSAPEKDVHFVSAGRSGYDGTRYEESTNAVASTFMIPTGHKGAT
jgi:hypothetical protein